MSKIIKVHSVIAGSVYDGPGMRYVLFVKGCPMRCKFCHNPDTWTQEGAEDVDTDEIVRRVVRYKGYFGKDGGFTITGGEPLMQLDALIELFQKLKKENINTCLDTSGVIFNPNNPELMKKFDELIKYTDLVLLDIKQIDNEKHIWLTGKPNTNILEFGRYLSEHNIPIWSRHVIVPGISMDDETLTKTKEYLDTLKTVEERDVLPYHTMGVAKYKELGIPYPLDGVRTPTKSERAHAEFMLGARDTDVTPDPNEKY